MIMKFRLNLKFLRLATFAVVLNAVDAVVDVEFPPPDRPYIAPKSPLTRGPCPGFNTLANHGYIRRDGKEVAVEDVGKGLAEVFGINYRLIKTALKIQVLSGNLKTINGTHFNLYDMYNYAKMHDASLLRRDHHFEPNAQFNEGLYRQMVNASSDGEVITRDELLAFRRERILDSQRNNPGASILLGDLAFDNMAHLFLGRDPLLKEASLSDILSFAREGRIPEGWAPRYIGPDVVILVFKQAIFLVPTLIPAGVKSLLAKLGLTLVMLVALSRNPMKKSKK